VARRDLAAFERGLRRGEERVAPHRDRRRSGMRRLAGEAEHVALDAEGAEHDAGRLVIDSSTGPARCAARDTRARRSLQLRVRVEHAVELDAVLARARRRAACPGDPSARARSSIFRLPAAADDPSRLRPKRGAFLVRPVHDAIVPVGRAPGEQAQRAETSGHAEARRRASRRSAPESRWPPTITVSVDSPAR
jgi:hypothetical protein